MRPDVRLRSVPFTARAGESRAGVNIFNLIVRRREYDVQVTRFCGSLRQKSYNLVALRRRVS